MKKVLRFEITDKCNQRCKMCWSNDWKHEELDWEIVEKMINDFHKSFPDGSIVLTSREPLLANNFKKVVALCNKLNINLGLLTNGTLFTNDICKIIMNSTIYFISISIHGSKEFHNNLVCSKVSYDKILAGIDKINYYKKKFKRDDLNIRITSVMNRDLIDSIDNVLNLVKKYNLKFRLQHFMWHSSEEKNNNIKYIKGKYNYLDETILDFDNNSGLLLEDVCKIIEKTEKICLNNKIDYQIYPNLDKEGLEKWYLDKGDYNNKYCDHIKKSIRVRANGDVVLCQYINKVFGNVKVDNIKNIINTKIYKNMINDISECGIPICNHCCHFMECNKENNI